VASLDERVGEGEILALVQQCGCPQRVGELGGARQAKAGQGGRVAQRRAPSQDDDSVSEHSRPLWQPDQLAVYGTGDLFGPERAEPPGGLIAGVSTVGDKLS
jgi:hypothetical protein